MILVRPKVQTLTFDFLKHQSLSSISSQHIHTLDFEPKLSEFALNIWTYLQVQFIRCYCLINVWSRSVLFRQSLYNLFWALGISLWLILWQNLIVFSCVYVCPEVTCWNTGEVCSMLRSIGLSQYEENFMKQKVKGKDLLTMQKQDFIVSSMVFFLLITWLLTKLCSYMYGPC